MQSKAAGAERCRNPVRLGGLEVVIETALARPGDHGGRKVDPGQPLGALAHRDAHEPVATAEVERMGEAAAGRGDIQGRGDQGRAAIVEPLGQVRREAGRVIVEKAR